MAIPLRHIDGSGSKAQRRSKSIDSEMSARLAYALGKHVDLDDQLSDVDSAFTHSDNEDDEAFLKENDPLNSDYDTPPQQKVHCPSTPCVDSHATVCGPLTDCRNRGGSACISILLWGLCC
jgi:hypothetical protein